MRRFVLTLAAVLSLSGIARAQSAPTPTPIAIPTTVPTATPVPTPATLKTIEPAPEQPLDLARAIDLALANHGSIGVARQQMTAAEQRITQARSSLYPQLNASATYQTQSQRNSRVIVDNTGLGGTTVVTNSDTNHQVSLVFSQNLFDSGLTRAQVRGARAGAISATAGVGVARSNVAFNVADAYFNQLRQEKLLTLADQQVAQARKHVEQVQAQITAGTSAKVDIQPVQVALSQALYNSTQARTNVLIAQSNLRDQLGLDRGPALKLVDVTATVPTVGNLETYQTVAVAQRPDLKQAAANIQQSEAQQSVAKINSRPRVSVDANYVEGFFNSPTRQTWVLGGTLSVPIFDAGARRAAVREAGANLEADRIRYEQLRKDVGADVQAAYDNFVTANDKITAANALAEQARVNLEVASEKYRQGLGIALEVFDAEVQYFNAQITATQALYDYYVTRSSLDRAIGTWAVAAPLVAATTAPAAQR